MHILRQNRREVINKVHQIADFLKLQREDPVAKSHDVDLGAECAERIGDAQEERRDRLDEEERGVVVGRGGEQSDQGDEQGDPDSQTEHQQEHAQEGNHQPADHGEHGRYQEDPRGHHAQDPLQGKQGHPR